LSVDSKRYAPILSALNVGADIINDVSGLSYDSRVLELHSKAKGFILMAHPDGLISKKIDNPIKETKFILKKSLNLAAAHKIKRNKIVLDPGIGFFRNTGWPWWKWDLFMIQNFAQLTTLNVPLLIGVSRKSFIGKILENKPPEKRLAGSLASTAIAVKEGASLIRTHDVGETRDAVRLAEAIYRGL
jgi:dihydropteroate synthase